jgi:hypothetical protein
MSTILHQTTSSTYFGELLLATWFVDYRGDSGVSYAKKDIPAQFKQVFYNQQYKLRI